MGDFRKKISCRLISKGESLQGKLNPALKKISLMTYIKLKKKNLHC